MKNVAYQKFVKRWEEVMELPPQRVGPLTPTYKRLVAQLKVMPWPMLVFGALMIVVGLYFLLGTSITFLVSILQRGF